MNMHIIDLKTNSNGIKFSLAGRMATEIIECQQTIGSCLPQDLNEKGFTPDEVDQHWNAAHFLITINDLNSWGEYNHG